MIEFFRKLFGQPGSSSTAKERLRLVLMSDHLSLAPEMVDRLKDDLVDVLSRYVEVDRAKIDVTFEQQERALAMLANIPILSVNRSTGGGQEPELPLDTASASMGTAASPPPPSGAEQQPASLPRRKRRKRAAQKGASSANPAPAT